MARLSALSNEEVCGRMEQGHRLYVARMGDEPVGYGWCATRGAEIGELDMRIRFPASERYLWDFATLPEWRGRGVYPRLLQAILADDADAEYFWIGHTPENVASRRGILRAGFTALGELRFLPGGGVGLEPDGDLGSDRLLERAAAGAAVLGVPLLPRHTRT
jgi:GNAT superfamily N-acetyltransferase